MVSLLNGLYPTGIDFVLVSSLNANVALKPIPEDISFDAAAASYPITSFLHQEYRDLPDKGTSPVRGRHSYPYDSLRNTASSWNRHKKRRSSSPHCGPGGGPRGGGSSSGRRNRDRGFSASFNKEGGSPYSSVVGTSPTTPYLYPDAHTAFSRSFTKDM